MNDVLNGLIVIIILQHHLMNLENSCIGFSHFFQGFLVQILQLLHGGLSGLSVTGDLPVGILDLHTLYLLLILLMNTDPANGDSAEYTFSLVDFHDFSPLLTIIL